jgi:AraC-like DNA-binding protein
MSLTHEDLAAGGQAIIGNPLAAPSFTHRIRPPQPLLARLSNLHKAAAHLAKSAPDILANPEVARAMEHALIEVMILCLAGGGPIDTRSAHRHHHAVMRRLEEVLQASSGEPLYMTELCTAAGVSYRMLRDCCQEHLGMSPKRYLWLRRMHFARRALRNADPMTMTVTETATNYGFWELGRFSVAYRSLFGEPPSTALRRPREDATTGEGAASPWKFADSA